ncbi:alpha/beta hydrolase [Pseudomonas aeruginosa]
MRHAFALGTLALLVGCANHQAQLGPLIAGHPGALQVYRTAGLPVQAWAPAGNHQRLRVFIEGDGYAWVTASRPSLDPTPRQPTILQLALSQRDAGYLGRPCQYVSGDACKPLVWTDQRFSRQSLQAMAAAIDGLKLAAGATKVELVGYSGGAAIALLLAATRDDVVAVQTIAGNLSPRTWAQQQGHTGLAGALDPIDYSQALSGIPQRHLVAMGDTVVPRGSQDAYVASLAPSSPVEVLRYQGNHWEGVAGAWAQFGALPLPESPR